MKKADKKLIADWIDALRNKGYKQNTGCLRKGDRFCCLGVFMDISGDGEWITKGGETFYRGEEYDVYCDLPSKFRKIIGDEMHNKLVAMNDRGTKPFTEIADFLEEEFKCQI